MADITEVLNQASIADSILDDANIVGEWHAGSLAEEPIEQPEADSAEVDPFVQQQAASRNEALANLNTDRERNEREQPEQVDAAQPQELTPESVQQGIQALDNLVQQYELNDPASAKGLATDLCEAFGTDVYKEGMNVEALGSTMAKAVLSTAQIYDAVQGDISKLAPVSPEAAKHFVYDLVKSFGDDPRNVPTANMQNAAQVVQAGIFNFLNTYQRSGRIADVTRLNEPEAAVHFLAQFKRAFGDETPVNQQMALKIADGLGKYVLNFLGKVNQMQPQAPQQTNRRASSGQRQARSNRFRSNADIFSNDVLDRLELEKATRKRGEGFEAKPKSARSRFSSNQDIFSEDVMGEYDLRRL